MVNLNWYKAFPSELKNVPEKSGVYVISVLLKVGKFAVVYVGQSSNLKNRIETHFSENETNIGLKEYVKKPYSFKISYAEVSESELDGIEKFLIHHYNPKFNIQEGNGDSKNACNLPDAINYPA